MADVAHDASGPASLPPQQADRSGSPDRERLRVFISYSRNDLAFADQLTAALDACGFECSIDRHGISGGEEWKRRLGNMISEADTVAFVLSPTSARSEICDWEVEEATRLGKRILPVICRPLEGAGPPPRLRERNYIFFHADPKAAPDAGFGTGLASLIAALNTDFDWLREHTRYLQRATEWDRGGRPANRLLSGNDIAEAKAWVARRPKSAPEPTPLHLDFIRASEAEAEARSIAQRKQLEAMATAQADRETALHEAEEALKQAADAQRKRARIRNIAFVVVSIFALLAALFGWRTEQHRKIAEEQRAVAEREKKQTDQVLAGARDIIVRLQDQMDTDAKKEVFALLLKGADHGDAPSMRNLGITYLRGFGVAQDYAKAREWYEKAADNGDAEAMTNLGLLYQNGQGVAQNYAEARAWYKKAADKDHASAKALLEQLPVVEGGMAREIRGVAAKQPAADDIFKALAFPKMTRAAPEVRKADEASFIDSLRNRPARSLTPPEREQIAAIAQARPSIDIAVNFDYNSDKIGAQATPQVTVLGKVLSMAELKGGTFIIAGHMAPVGSAAYNQSLSERRADAIKRFVSENFEIEASNLVTVGYGRSPSMDMSETFTRVQIINVSDK